MGLHAVGAYRRHGLVFEDGYILRIDWLPKRRKRMDVVDGEEHLSREQIECQVDGINESYIRNEDDFIRRVHCPQQIRRNPLLREIRARRERLEGWAR